MSYFTFLRILFRSLVVRSLADIVILFSSLILLSYSSFHIQTYIIAVGADIVLRTFPVRSPMAYFRSKW